MYWSRIVAALVIWSCATVAGGAELQRNQPIYIESDSLRIDDAKGVSVYKGNVIFRQGIDSLKADELVIYSEQRQEIKKIVATGRPARFDHDAASAAEKSWGEAESIEYDASSASLVLSGAARFQQGDNQFSGNRIEYDAERKLVKAGKVGAAEGRVKIVIQPRQGAAQDETAGDGR